MPVGNSIYQERDSTLHQRIAPRTKLALLVTTFVLALAYNHPAVLGGLTAVVIAAAWWAKLDFRRFLPILLAAGWFLVLGILIWPFYIQVGPPLFFVLGSAITLTGLLFGLAMGLRVALMVAAAGVWMMSTSPQKMTLGLVRIGLPPKAGVAMSTAIRLVPLLNAKRATIAEAQRARGRRLETGNPLSRARKSVSILGPLLLSSIDLAQALAVAMDARGFGARPDRTSLVDIQITPLDRAIIAGCVVAAVGSVILRLLGVGVIVQGYL